MSAPGDRAQDLTAAVAEAAARGTPLRIIGSGSKASLTDGAYDHGAAPFRWLSVADHRGIIDYQPEELVVTARAGTPLAELEALLASRGQLLPFEPPRFRGAGTLGGAVAAGLAGPARPWRGAVRDSVLGVELANGRGERLRFGGQVMKNVAGYDVSRLQAGAFGTLGLLLSVSVRLLPRPEAERTRVFELAAADAVARCRGWARQALPLSATAYLDGQLFVRLSGAAAAVAAAETRLGGDAFSDDGFWPALRDHRHPFFSASGRVLWRAVVPPAAAVTDAAALIGWGGAERWSWREPGDASVAAEAAAAGGHARPFDGGFGYRDGPHLPEAERRLGARLREAFDPAHILNSNLGKAAEPDHAD